MIHAITDRDALLCLTIDHYKNSIDMKKLFDESNKKSAACLDIPKKSLMQR